MTILIEWAEKYRPQTLSEIVGNKKALETLRTWANEWVHGVPEKRAVILYGQAGVGKTSAAHALAKDMGWEVIELNASDQRTAGVIERIAGSASTMGSLDGSASRRFVILDEADNLHGTSDRGGTRAIGNVIKKSNQPIVLIANDVYGLSSTVRSLCLEIKFNVVQARSIVPALKKICKAEGMMMGVGVIEKIADGAGGDMRSAVNDLQAAAMGREELSIEDIATSQRDTKENIFKVLPRIFKGTSPKEALKATYGLDESPEDLVHWINENLPIQYNSVEGEDFNADLRDGFEYLSHADIFLGRVKKRQNYRMWRYASMLMTGGVTVSKSHRRSGFIKYQAPSLWRKMGQLRAKRNMRDNVASKIGEHCGESMRYSRSELSPIYSRMLEDEDYAVDIVAGLELEIDEILYLTKRKKVTKQVQKIYDDAQSIIKEKVSEDIEFFAAPKKKVADQKGRQLDLGQIQSSTKPEPTKDKKEEKVEVKKVKNNQPHKPQKTLFDF